MLKRALYLAAAAAVAAPAFFSPPPARADAATPATGRTMAEFRGRMTAYKDYTLNCAGCHRVDGSGTPGYSSQIPDLRNSLGSFTRTRAGRDYLIRVPGSVDSLLSNGELANVLNYMVARFDPDLAGPDFKPFTANEIGAVRRPYEDVRQARMEVAQALAEEGYPTAEYRFGENDLSTPDAQ